MTTRSIRRRAMGLGIAALAGVAAATVAYAVDPSPTTEKSYGLGLPRGYKTQLWSDAAFPEFPLKPGQEAYQDINAQRMKADVVALSQIAVSDQARNKQWWGRFPGTDADRAGQEYMLNEFRRLGMDIEYHPFTVPSDWRPRSWSMSYNGSAGETIDLVTAFPVGGTKGTPPAGMTAEAVWLGIGADADFIGRDVKGKAVVIYSVFVPGGRSHSASDRAGLFNSNTKAQAAGAAMVINVMGVPGNGLFQPEGGLTKIPQMTISQDEGFALRERLAGGEKVVVTVRLDVDVGPRQAYWTKATLPGKNHRSTTADKHALGDEQIVIMQHTDGYMMAATDNNAGMASALELARHYAALPQAQRARTLVFVQFPDHHHGEASLKDPVAGVYANIDWSTVALKLTEEHPSEVNMYWYNDALTGSNQMSASRWNALGSPEFELMAFDTMRDFGVSVYAMEDGPKNSSRAPSFHIINHIVYHTSLDQPEWVPAEGLRRSTRAFASIIDSVNAMTIGQLQGPGWPYGGNTGSINGVGPYALP